MSFYKPRKKTEITIPQVETVWEWSDATECLEPKEVNKQDAIDNFQGYDLKSMITKNVVIQNDNPAVYGDTTLFTNMSVCDYREMFRNGEIPLQTLQAYQEHLKGSDNDIKEVVDESQKTEQEQKQEPKQE